MKHFRHEPKSMRDDLEHNSCVEKQGRGVRPTAGVKKHQRRVTTRRRERI